MVAGASAADAVVRARRIPKLRVGLHIVLVEGAPALPPERLPDLVDGSGHFRTDMARLGFDIFAKPSVRAQLAAEVDVPFAAYAATGLPLDHVNAHKHFHLHPTIAGTIIAVRRRYGMKAMRVPVEGVLQRLPDGLSQIYAHPATAGGFVGHAPGYRYADELAGLTSPDVVAAALRGGVALGLRRFLTLWA
jgi:predicted glycoside hydrolase/deacetylase ChbG (UPF0249 family)